MKRPNYQRLVKARRLPTLQEVEHRNDLLDKLKAPLDDQRKYLRKFTSLYRVRIASIFFTFYKINLTIRSFWSLCLFNMSHRKILLDHSEFIRLKEIGMLTLSKMSIYFYWTFVFLRTQVPKWTKGQKWYQWSGRQWGSAGNFKSWSSFGPASARESKWQCRLWRQSINYYSNNSAIF